VKTCFSIFLSTLTLCSVLFAQESVSSSNKKVRTLLEDLSTRIQNLETIFLVPGNMYIENGDASYALVELEKIKVLVKKLEGRVETMEHELRSQIGAIITLNQELSVILDTEGKSIKSPGKGEETLEEENHFAAEKEIVQREEENSELDTIRKSREFLETGEFEKAKKHYENFIETYPNSPFLPEVFFELADSQYQLGEWKNAANSYLEAFSLEPKGKIAPRALFGLAISLGGLREFDQACLTLEEVQLRFPAQKIIGEQDLIDAKSLMNCT